MRTRSCDVDPPVRSLPVARALAVVAAACWLLGGCVSSTTTTSGNVTTTPAPRTSDGKDIVTASDKTDQDRRADTRMDLARAYFGNQQYTTALDEVKQALQVRPDRADAYSLRGLIYGALGEVALADESFRRAIQLAPGDGDTLHNYGWVLCQERRYADADVQFNAAMQLPNYRGGSRTLLAQGVCQARGGDLTAAERTLSHAYELDPANPTTAVNLAEVLFRRAQFERALFYIRRVNARDEYISAQSLWLAARIEKKLNDESGVTLLGRQLRERFPQAPETAAFEKGRFDE